MFGKSVAQQFTPLDRAAGAAIGVGALNWGLVGLTNFDAIRAALGRGAMARLAYAAVGASAVYAVVRGTKLARG